MDYVLRVRLGEKEYAELILVVAPIISVSPDRVERASVEEFVRNLALKAAKKGHAHETSNQPPAAHKTSTKQ